MPFVKRNIRFKGAILLFTVFFLGCQTGSSLRADPTPQPTVAPKTYIFSDNSVFEASLDQLFALRWDQSVDIPSENLRVTHITMIEFECPKDAVCEVPLIARDFFEVYHSGELIGRQVWQPNMVFGDYVILTGHHYQGYDYRQHQFEMVLAVSSLDDYKREQEARLAQQLSIDISVDCDFELSQYLTPVREGTEAHMLGVYHSNSGRVDVHLERRDVPMILILSAYDSTEWVIELGEEVQLQRIILNGYNQQTVRGVEGIPIDDYSGLEKHIVSRVTRWSATQLGYQNGLAPEWVYQIEALAGVSLSTFSGCQRASSFSIGD